MKLLTPEQTEIISLLVEVADDEISQEQIARVNELVKDSEELQSFVLRILNQEAWLSQNSLHESTRSVGADLAFKIQELLTDAETCAVSRAVADRYTSESAFAPRTRLSQSPLPKSLVVRNRAENLRLPDTLRWVVPAACAVLLVGIGVAIGTLINSPSQLRESAAFIVDHLPHGGDSVPRSGLSAANLEARLVQYTTCVWGPEMHPRTGDSLRSGDSLNLINGLAELELGWLALGKARVRLEGPAGMVLMTQGGVNLNHGKLTAKVVLGNEKFAVETPFGRVEIAEDATIGVAVSPQCVEFHVFEGRAKVVTSWAAASVDSASLDVNEGESIQLTADEAGSVEIGRDIAAPGIFVSQIPMSDDLLDISDRYVAAIKEASPVCYWRFNQPVSGLIRNEMADRYHGQVLGNIEWVQEKGNWTIRCGSWLATDMPASHVVADRPLESVGVKSYSVEAWVKPSHAHLATIASILSPASRFVIHGILLELGGPSTIFTGREHPGRVRYLHRNPPADWGGNSCFSNRAYGLRKWQHIVAVKNVSLMQLYIDGQPVAKCEDTTSLPDGLQLLVGQLDRERKQRMFVGQLDEFAYYERALSAEEIQEHYRLVRPVESATRELNANMTALSNATTLSDTSTY